tara:strand:+ start:805 stop:1071 length:267 start_codon:yes stop_codon:yes gene_type:complete
MKKILWFRNLIFTLAFLTILVCVGDTFAKKGRKARFYDFSDQLINGEIKKPTAIYMESRTRAKFAKLLRLKKSFRRALILSYNDPLLK